MTKIINIIIWLFAASLMLSCSSNSVNSSEAGPKIPVVKAVVCGDFVEPESQYRTVFKSDGSAQELNAQGFVQSALYHYQERDRLYLRNMENTSAKVFKLSADGKNLTPLDTQWDKPAVANLPYACKPQQDLKRLLVKVCDYGNETQCCQAGDSDACLENTRKQNDIAALKKVCAERADGCIALIDAYESGPQPQEETGANPQEDLQKLGKALSQFNLYAEKKPLSNEQLSELGQACERWQTPELCRKVNSHLWRGGKYSAARDLLKQRCELKLDEQACENYKSMASLTFSATLPAATELPCGLYKSLGGSLSGDLDFQDRGLIPLGLGAIVRARLEEGRIKMRHDKGGDFIVAQLDANTLLGIDEWNEFAVYRRVTAPAQACAAPVVYKEVPLSDSCGLDKDPVDCCKTGDTQGCNRLGTMAGLSGKWVEAAGYYGKVCAAGVRIGCENWVRTVGETGNSDDVSKGLKTLCDKDPQHVACDVLESGSLNQMSGMHGLESMLKELSQEEKLKK